MSTQEKIRKLEQEITALWRVIEDERLWHPSIVREIKRRAKLARQTYANRRLRKAEEGFVALQSKK